MPDEDRFPETDLAKTDAEFAGITNANPLESHVPVEALEEANDKLIEALAKLTSSNISEKQAAAYKKELSGAIDHHSSAFMDCYDSIRDSCSEAELADILAGLIFHDEAAIFDFIENIAKDCAVCTIARTPHEALKRNILDEMAEIDEVIGDGDSASEKRTAVAAFFQNTITYDIDHCQKHLPDTYSGRDSSALMKAVGHHALDVLKIGVGAGIALAIANRFN